jgi:hypothetical protein
VLRGRQRHPRDGARRLTGGHAQHADPDRHRASRGREDDDGWDHRHALGTDAIEQLWQSFAELGELERNVLDIGDKSPRQVADTLERQLADGLLQV